jgi:hypothetical protein
MTKQELQALVSFIQDYERVTRTQAFMLARLFLAERKRKLAPTQ